MNEIDADFEAAQSAKGARLQSVGEFRRLFEHCSARGWFIQTVEAFEVDGPLERANLDFSILGLRLVERTATSIEDHRKIASEIAERAEAAAMNIVFQVWIDRLA